MIRLSFLLFFMLGFSPLAISENGIRDKTIGKPIPLVSVYDQTNKPFLWKKLEGKPVILSVIYSHCISTCSIITKSLKNNLPNPTEADGEYDLVTLTFEREDGPSDLTELREENQLPPNWHTVFAKNGVNHLLDFLDFRTFSLGNRQYSHPNLVVILDTKLNVSQYLYGTDFSRSTLAQALKKARQPQPAFFLSKQVMWLVFSIACLVLSVFLLMQYLSLSAAKASRSA